MKKIQEVLSSYGIYQATITKISNKVYKIDDGKQQFALKRSELSGEEVSQWEHVFHQADKRKLVSILPAFLTINSSLYQKFDQSIFYLTPWINRKSSTIESLYRSIGSIHSQTKRSQAIDQENIIQQFNNYKKTCVHTREKLLSYVKKFESHRYMSPIELQVCTHYRDMQQSLKTCIEYVERLIDEETTSIQWSNSLCHGNLRLSHLLEGEQPYLINWEQARYDYAITDLVRLFTNDIVHYDAPVQMYLDSFNIYMKENHLNHGELLLLIIHLLDVTRYMEIVQAYIENRSQLTMIQQIQKLQTTYRQQKFALKLSRYLEKEFISILADDFDD